MPAGLILWFMGSVAAFGIPARIRKEHFDINRKRWQAFTERLRQQKGGKELPWIEDQNGLGEFAYGRHNRLLSRLLLGGRPLSARENACEVVAVYNALLALGPEAQPDLPALLETFEKRGISLGGYFGTSFGAICRFFRGGQWHMKVLKGKKITKDALKEAENGGVSACIMMTENSAGRLGAMIHTICISPKNAFSQEAAIKWRAHNDYEGSRVSDNLTDAVFGYHNAAGRPLGVILLYRREETER